MPAAAEPTPDLDPSTASTRPIVVADHYEIDPDRPLGTGGMSVVYEGRDLKNRRTVAMRTLRPEQAQNAETRARFRKEARTMAFIQHPNVARVYDLWEDDQSAWVAMEYVPGESLRDVLAENGPLSYYDIEPILSQSASALDKLHRSQMVHLDVKPANLIQTPDGTIKLIDFGLAQESHAAQELLHGMAYGSAAYLSPEQAAGEVVGPASDVYSLGCVVYELLTGRAPFEDPYRSRSSQEMLQAHLHLQPDRPSEANKSAGIPDWCDELVIWTLLKDPDARISSPGRFAELYEQGVLGRLSAADVRKLRTARQPKATVTANPTVPGQTYRRIDPAPQAQPVYRQEPTRRKTPLLLRMLGPLRPFIWRLIVALLVLNGLLAGALYIQRGEIPGIVSSGAVELTAGQNATVAVDGLNLRTDAGMTSDSIGILSAGQMVYLRGEPVTLNGDRWWPVTVGNPNDGLEGYVWENGLEHGKRTIGDRIDIGIDNAIDRIREKIGV
ncbi:MAG TPA: protein kinase [Thermomicrobiales bacterium]|jgi:serine/threonine-protein kinase|nr:protein kinase [Thermomicrobiales bacterium]